MYHTEIQRISLAADDQSLSKFELGTYSLDQFDDQQNRLFNCQQHSQTPKNCTHGLYLSRFRFDSQIE